jgi:hypothetical protein
VRAVEDIGFTYLFGRQVEIAKGNVTSFLQENIKEFKEIMVEFHNFFTRLAKEKGEAEGERISHRFATLMYAAIKLYFFSNWCSAGIDWTDILATEAALTEIAVEVTDSVKESTEKKSSNDISIR